MFSFGRKSNSVIFSAIAAIGIQFTSTTALAVYDNSTQTPAQRLCWQMNKESEIKKKVDPKGLVIFSKKENKYIPYKFYVLPAIECLEDGVKWVFKSLDESGKETLTDERFFKPTQTGGLSLDSDGFSQSIDYSGDGINHFKVVYRVKEPSRVYSNPIKVSDVFEYNEGWYYHNVKCDKSAQELKSLGVEFVISDKQLTDGKSWEENFTLKNNSLYTYTYSNLSDFSELYQTDKSDISFRCDFKTANNPQMKNTSH